MRELRLVTNNSVRSGWLKIWAEKNKRFKWIKAVLAERGIQLGQLAEGQISLRYTNMKWFNMSLKTLLIKD